VSSDPRSHPAGDPPPPSSVAAVERPPLGVFIGLFWACYGGMMTAILLSMLDRESTSFGAIAGFSFGGAFVWAIVTPAFLRLVRWMQGSPTPHVGRVALLLVVGVLVASVLATAVSGWAYVAYDQLEAIGFGAMFRYRLPLDAMASLVVVTAGLARTYLDDLHLRQRETVALRAQLVESRLDSLRAQLNPHFLFNTLNAVAGLATTDPKRVQKILTQLSDLLRYTLTGSADQEITVDSELALLRQYLDILELRYTGFLKTHIISDPSVRDALVPNMILQPLAENALKHGVSRAGGEGLIEARATREGDHVVLTITDSGPGKRRRSAPAANQRQGAGFGLRHTRERLQQLYGADGLFQLIPTSEGGMIAELRIPYRSRVATTAEHAAPAQSSA
jgi:two-component system, LytTR family, sensor kinase